MQQRWPSHIWIVRHGESAGNVARDAAMSSGATHIDIAERDVDGMMAGLDAVERQVRGGAERAAALRIPTAVPVLRDVIRQHRHEFEEDDG